MCGRCPVWKVSSVHVQVKVCKDEIPCFEKVAEGSSLLINGGCSKLAVTSVKVCIHVSSKDEDSII